MKWLHISDIHYNPLNDGRSSKQLREKLLQYLNECNITVDNVFITGDFRNALLQNNENELHLAEDAVNFIKEVSKNVGVTMDECIHIVPGNHDLTREDNFEKINRIRQSYDFEKGDFSQDDLKYLINRFNYFKRIDELLHPNIKNWTDDLLPIHQYKCFETYNLLYLNTSITCGNDEDRNNLVIGNLALYDALEKIKNENPQKPILILAHHSMDNFDKKEIKALERIFKNYPVKLYLCGDAHILWSRKINDIMEITMGCLKNDQEVQTVFSFGEIKENGEFSIETHIWDKYLSVWGPYTHFNEELTKWNLSLLLKKKRHAQIITNILPFPVSNFFIGRDKDIFTIEETLKDKKIVNLYATPGMGKTETCRKLFEQYTKINSPFFAKIGWLIFNENIINTFYNQFNDIEEKDINAYWIKIKKYIFENGNNLLLIIDNANTLSPKDLSDLNSLGCSIILTSRGKVDRITSIPIGKMTIDNCRSLYRSHSNDDVSEDNILNQIIYLADRHTLSIELLSKTQFASGKSSEDILKSIMNHGFNLSDINDEISYSHNPETALDEKFENIFIGHMAKIYRIAEIKNTEEIKILKLYSVLSSEPFPLESLKCCFEVENLNALNQLVKKGWLNKNDNHRCYNMHPVVASVIQHYLGLDFETVKAMIIWINHELIIYADQMFIQKLWLFPHSLSIARIFENHICTEIANFKKNIACIFKEQGKSKKALEWYYSALNIQENLFGNKSPLYLEIYNYIALTIIDQGNYLEALKMLKKVYEFSTDSLNEENLFFGTLYHNIALVHDHMGNFRESLRMYYKALEIKNYHYPQNHYSFADTYNNLATVYESMGNYTSAIDYFERCLSIYRDFHNSNHSDIAKTYNNLATVYAHKGDTLKALELTFEALSIYEVVLTKDHPTLAMLYNNIGLNYYTLGEYLISLEWHTKSLNIRENTIGPNHYDTAVTYSNIGLVYDDMNDYKNALKWYNKSLKFCEIEENRSIPFTGCLYNNIGAVFFAIQEYSESIKWYQKSLLIREELLGKEHPDTATTYNNIGVAYLDEGDLFNAMEFIKTALKIRLKILGKEHFETADSYQSLALCFFKGNDYDRAVDYAKKAALIYMKSLGTEHYKTKLIINQLDTYLTIRK